MKDELQGKLVEILTSIQTAAGKASDFAMEQLPDIAQSYVMFGRAYETVFMLFAVSIVMAVWAGTWKVYKKASRPEGVFDGMPPPLAFAFGGVISIVPFLMVVENIKPLLMVWFAPKVWLLKEIASLIK
jgi:hypothetical protein